MTAFYTIGGIIVIAIIGLPILYIFITNVGKKEERYNNMKEDIKIGQKINRDNAKRANMSSADVRNELRNDLKN